MSPTMDHVILLDTGNMKSIAFYQSLYLHPRRGEHCLPGRATQVLYLSTQGMCNGCGKQDLQHQECRLPLVTMRGCNWLAGPSRPTINQFENSRCQTMGQMSSSKLPSSLLGLVLTPTGRRVRMTKGKPRFWSL